MPRVRFGFVLSLMAIGALAAGCGGGSGQTGDVGTAPTTGGESPATPPGVPLLPVGAPCSTDDQCQPGGSGAAVCLTDGYQGGYCAVADCAAHGHDCPGNGSSSQCVSTPANRCLKLCSLDVDCRSGYACQSLPDAAGHGSATVCLPR